jgi:preprotein translocase subunit SecE
MNHDKSLLEKVSDTIVIFTVTVFYCVPFFGVGYGIGTGIFG